MRRIENGNQDGRDVDLPVSLQNVCHPPTRGGEGRRKGEIKALRKRNDRERRPGNGDGDRRDVETSLCRCRLSPSDSRRSGEGKREIKALRNHKSGREMTK